MKSDGKTSGSIAITHGDVDGMVCAAQIIRREKSKCDIQFSNARCINSKLRSILKCKAHPTRVYVTDIAANEDAANVVEQLARNGVEVFWIDHHPWSDEVIDRINQICTVAIYNASLSTPAGVLLGRWLSQEDPYYDRVGNICYAYEKGTVWERNWFRLLSNCVGKADKTILERLAYNREFTEEDLDRIQNQIAIDKLSEEILAEEPHTEQTNSGKTLAVYDTTETPGVYLGHKVFDHHAVDYCLIRILHRKWQMASNPLSGLTLEAIAGMHDLGGAEIVAAGRPDRLMAIEVTGSQISSDAHERIMAWVKKML